MALAVYPWQVELARELHAMRDRLPNGLLVYGPRGIGTFELVHAFAKSLLCEHPGSDGAPCGQCKGCVMARAYTHPDIRYVVSEAEALPRQIPFEAPDNASADRKNLYREILIHQPRALADFLTIKSHQGGVRIVLVYPADKIRAEAAASLLKSLEEPPEQTVFLLVADELDHVLPTIRSRCRLVRATPPSFEQALAWVEQQGVERAEVRLQEVGGMPLAVFESDPHLTLAPDIEAHFLSVLRMGKAADNDVIIGNVPRDFPLPAAALFFSRWAWDLAGVYAGMQPRYFPQEVEPMRQSLDGVTPAKLYQWINSVRDVRQASGHTLNARVVIEQLLLAYVRALK